MVTSFIRRSKAFYRINPVYNDCPSCKASGTLLRSHSRNFKEKFISKFLFKKFYRCKQCGWRGSLKTIKITPASIFVVFLYLLLIGGAAFITHQILKTLLRQFL